MEGNNAKEEFRSIAEEIVGSFVNRSPRKFLSIRLKGQFEWPHKFTQLCLFDRDWLLWPKTVWDKPGIIIHCPKGDGQEEGKLVLKFLSALAWVHEAKIYDEGFWTVGSHPNSCFRDEPLSDSLLFSYRGLQLDEYDYLPFPEDQKAQIALALYREAICIENVAYKFLSYFKILNIIKGSGNQQIGWINSNISKISNHDAINKIVELESKNHNVGEHLYYSGRCAVAHANTSPVINPDNPDDRRRLSFELPVIKGLAELVIEQEFGIKSSTTVWREHLYELRGFKKLLGSNLVELIKGGYVFDENGNNVFDLIESRLPKICIRLRGEPEKPFEMLHPKVVDFDEGRLWLECRSDDSLSIATLLLDFKNERIGDEESHYTDIIYGLSVIDDGTAKAAILSALNNKFIGKIYGNGVIEIWDDTECLLGRKDPYVAVNINMSATQENYRIATKNFNLLAVMRTIGNRHRKKLDIEKLLSCTSLRKVS